MSEKPNNPQAFPTPNILIPPPGSFAQMPAGEPGMTLRDWFAGQALVVAAALARNSMSPGVTQNCKLDENVMAVGAYALADAMLDAREKTDV